MRLSTVTAVDRYPAEPRFEVVYHLHSIERNERVRLKCRLEGDDPEIESVTSVWRSANWYEREVFDLFGIRFRNHPDLRRIMMPDDWEGHPLRKDYPDHGDKDLAYERPRHSRKYRLPRSRRSSRNPARAAWSSTWGRSTRPPTACCACCWNWTAKPS